MLIRFVVQNFLSIGDELEFNLLPEQYKKTFPHHVYEDKNVRLLKTSAIYGANGAGKSNVFAALSYLQQLVLGDQDVPKSTSLLTYRLSDDKISASIRMEVEFIHDGFSLAYGIEFQNGIVLNEYLYELGFKNDDTLIFERKYEDGKTVLNVDRKKVFKTKGDAMFLNVVEEHFLENHLPLLRFANVIKKPVVKAAYDWFMTGLYVITPYSKFAPLVEALSDAEFNKFANDVLNSFNTGLEKLEVETMPLEEYVSDSQMLESVREKLHKDPAVRIVLDDLGVTAALIDGQEVALKPYSYHSADNGKLVKFELDEESDGSRRLIDYIPLFQILTSDATVLIDEFERSIHPSLLKAMVRKILGPDSNIKGQLIFSTHDCNLLDQSIFRQDEIWFVEKKDGKTTMYPLTDFQIRQELDIKKGYINGRFGAIPFLGNLDNLNWKY